MSETVGIRELRQRASELLKRVAGGDSFTVSDRGRPVARIVPLQGGTLEQLVLEGRASGPDGNLLSLAEELGLPDASSGGMPPSTALAALRGDER
ncbi:MAG TPA: type II toxin-antitoxin system prevent-host-death family antitoxin [Acidimicrobiales bacterium]